MLSIWQKEPSRVIGLLASLVVAAVVIWAPLDPQATGPLIAALVFAAHELVRARVTPTGSDEQTSGAPPTLPGGAA